MSNNMNTYNCKVCSRSFDRIGAYQQHLRDSNAHTVVRAPSAPAKATPAANNAAYGCDLCERSFTTAYALDQHQRHAPEHSSPANTCKTCDRGFHNRAALEQHRRDSPAHRQQQKLPAQTQKKRESPLDAYFRSFPGYRHNPALPPATSYANVRRYMRWRPHSAESRKAWMGYQTALGEELRMHFGGDIEDLAAWHAVCRAVGIAPLPKSCAQSQEVLRRVHVNIVDLVEWGRSDHTQRVQCFRTLNGLRAYTQRTGKVFRNTLEDDEDNVVLRHLLRKLFIEN